MWLGAACFSRPGYPWLLPLSATQYPALNFTGSKSRLLWHGIDPRFPPRRLVPARHIPCPWAMANNERDYGNTDDGFLAPCESGCSSLLCKQPWIFTGIPTWATLQRSSSLNLKRWTLAWYEYSLNSLSRVSFRRQRTGVRSDLHTPYSSSSLQSTEFEDPCALLGHLGLVSNSPMSSAALAEPVTEP